MKPNTHFKLIEWFLGTGILGLAVVAGMLMKTVDGHTENIKEMRSESKVLIQILVKLGRIEERLGIKEDKDE